MTKHKVKRFEFRWTEFCGSMFAMGLMNDFSKGECLRISNQLKKRVSEGHVVKLARGRYAVDVEVEA
jgi:hypothetical protein